MFPRAGGEGKSTQRTHNPCLVVVYIFKISLVISVSCSNGFVVSCEYLDKTAIMAEM